jgi:hypothetical protein
MKWTMLFILGLFLGHFLICIYLAALKILILKF